MGGFAGLLAVPEVLPEMGQMIECVGIDSLFHRVRPLLVCDWHILNRPPDSLTKDFDNLPHCQSLAHQGVDLWGRNAGAGKERCGDSGYIFGAGKWNDSVAIAPGQ